MSTLSFSVCWVNKPFMMLTLSHYYNVMMFQKLRDEQASQLEGDYAYEEVVRGLNCLNN